MVQLGVFLVLGYACCLQERPVSSTQLVHPLWDCLGPLLGSLLLVVL